jgi:hypothetical protein
MKRHLPLYPHPLLAWGALALRAAEMWSASAHVIDHRARRSNSVAQLFEMGNEKVQAAIESSHAMTRQWLRMQGRGGADPWSQWAALLSSGLTPYHSRAVRNARHVIRRA